MGKNPQYVKLHHFFAPMVHGQATEGLFQDLLISQEENGRYIRDYQGQYPAIFLTFKDIGKGSSLGEVLNKISQTIRSLCVE